MGRPHVTDLGTITNGSCPLCLAPLDSAGHLLGECSHRDIKSMHIARHNKAVGLIQDAIASGPLGGSYMVMDACGRDATPDTVAATRLPPWLLPTMPARVRDKLRPDILILEGLPLHTGIALTTASPSLSHLQRSCRIHIIEVGYCSDSSSR